MIALSVGYEETEFHLRTMLWTGSTARINGQDIDDYTIWGKITPINRFIPIWAQEAAR